MNQDGGLMQAVPQPKAAPILKQIVQKIDSEISAQPQYKEPYLAVLVSGMKMLVAPQTKPELDQKVQSIQSPEQVPEVVRDIVLTALRIIDRESQGKMKTDAAMLASIVLMVYVLEYIESRTGVPVSPDLVVQTFKSTAPSALTFLHANPQQVRQLLAQVQGSMKGEK